VGLTALLWLQPPAVAPVPSRTGPEGPPRPLGLSPPEGPLAAATAAGPVLAQDRALLHGPFPRGGLVRGISDAGVGPGAEPGARAIALSRIRQAGASVVRIRVDWRDTVEARPPPGFDPRDPASPAYRFGTIDANVESVVDAGLTPLLVVSQAPAFAEAPSRWHYAYPGSWAPSPTALEDFATALARRYDGSFAPPGAGGGPLPRVRLFQAWNEPNLARYLEPQWIAEGGRWRAFSPLLYRQLLNGFYTGVKAAQPRATVLAAGIAPDGDRAGVGRVAPVTFLRGLLCLGPSGRRARAPACRAPVHFDALAFHPLSVGDPDAPAAAALDVSVADAAKVTALLHRAQRLRTVLPVGPKPVWVTELNWESAPQAAWGVPPGVQASWVSRALHRLWVAGVAVVEWEYLTDPYPAVRAETPTGGSVEYQRPVGLYAAGPGGIVALATPKQFLRGFALPFDPLRVDHRRVRVWALLMHSGERCTLQRPAATGAWRSVAALRGDRFGVLNALVPLRGAATLRLLCGALASAPASVASARSRLGG
jgi:hypothetical protein